MSRREDSEGRWRLKTRPSAPPHGADNPPPALVRVFSRAAIREVDRLAAAEFGIPSLLLMENAAIGVAGVVADTAESVGAAGPILIVCGRGNNGGDGLAAARHLHNAGLPVAIVLAARADEVGGDAAVHLRIARGMGLRIVEADAADPRRSIEDLVAQIGPPAVVVDALLGTGLDRPVRGTLAAVIGAINSLRARHGCAVVAVDIPSGLDAETGAALADDNPEPDGAVRADITVTLAGLKRGVQALAAQRYVGEVVVRPIGVPVELLERLGEPLPATGHPGQTGAPPIRPDAPEADERGVHPGESDRAR